ncbi:MAG: metal ABC transporter ATP-binding protein [Candidatus Bipolaricaulis sp.]|nr:metal ABC transporter ATP-binding protein [Candidatus Bipolaricaulis sp.]MDD5219249.1 metal ABC transporter ATP-binding protein [Candidatus Bipolaricaulis sp.]MDD5646537.1 metal ABC transporter ATP-binding protein [Candidatus Bipolaricaulis sp.]
MTLLPAPTPRPRRRAAEAAHDPTAPALRIRGLHVSYGERTALEDVTFDLPAGARLAVVGPNGAGKSTLLKAIAGILPCARGSIAVHGVAPEGHICIAYLPQRSDVDWRFPVTVVDAVMMGRTGRLGPLRRPKEPDRTIVQEALARVDLADRGSRRIGDLSGGEQQRMFLARAIAQEAEVVLLDEPLAGLDVSSQNEILVLLERLPKTTLLVALHDLGIAATRFDVLLLLRSRVLGFGRSADVLRPETLSAAYGGSLRMVKAENGVLVVHDTTCSGEDRCP